MDDRLVLGIDAAWTNANPSGVSLVLRDAGRWSLVAAASSYGHFLRIAGEPAGNASDHAFDGAALLKAAKRLGGRAVDIISVDMPLSRMAIVGRRAADDAVSRGLLPVSRTPSLGVLVGSEVDHGTKDNGTTDVQPGVQV